MTEPLDPEIVERSEPDIREVLLARTEFEGPLPPPDLFRQYEEVLPGSAERILAMAEHEAAFRHELARGLIANANTRLPKDWFNTSAAVAVACALSIVAGVMVLNGYAWPASLVVCVKIAAIATTLIWGRRNGGSVPHSESSSN